MFLLPVSKMMGAMEKDDNDNTPVKKLPKPGEPGAPPIPPMSKATSSDWPSYGSDESNV